MEKGKTNNPNGRPRGVPNKVTLSTRSWINNLINKNRRQLEKDLMTIEPKERLAVIAKLLSFVVPTMKETQVSTDNLPEETLDLIIHELTKNVQTDEN
jgi:hypothetical protein